MEYNWRPAVGTDIGAIVKLAQQHFETEIDEIFKPDPLAYGRNLTFAVVRQFYYPLRELVSVADTAQGIIAYTWAEANQSAPWSDDHMVVVKMAHVQMDLSGRDRVRLVGDMLQLWEKFAALSNTPIVCSTTMRRDQSGFLRLHERNGYDVRGSYAYKRIKPLVQHAV